MIAVRPGVPDRRHETDTRMSRKHWPVNWVDGMKITKEHFREQEAHLREEIAVLTAGLLSDDGFGVLPDPETGAPALDYEVSTEKVIVRECRAVTRGGHLIVVGAHNNAHLARSMSDVVYGDKHKEGERLVIVLRLHPTERDGLGAPDPDEYPLRQPYATEKVSLEAIPLAAAEQMAVYEYAVPLAEVVRVYQGVEAIGEYVVPAVRMELSPALRRAYEGWRKTLLALEADAYEIIRKIRDKHRNKLGNQLSADLLALAETIIRYIASDFDRLTVSLPQAPASETIVWFRGLARAVRTELRLAGNQEGMQHYLQHFIRGVDATDLLAHCNALCDHRHHHVFLRASLDRVTAFVDFVHMLFGQLRQLDYHDIATPTIIDGRYYNQRERGPSSAPAPPPRERPAPSGTPAAPIRIRSRTTGPGKSTPAPPSTEPPNGDGWGLE